MAEHVRSPGNSLDASSGPIKGEFRSFVAVHVYVVPAPAAGGGADRRPEPKSQLQARTAENNEAAERKRACPRRVGWAPSTSNAAIKTARGVQLFATPQRRPQP